ncbi:MAG: hypothetical protein K2Y71_05735 [Xanthobacteraceae bacterium]|nr:hypothetical protein [Xanthobacteraceae bacterium]
MQYLPKRAATLRERSTLPGQAGWSSIATGRADIAVGSGTDRRGLDVPAHKRSMREVASDDLSLGP